MSSVVNFDLVAMANGGKDLVTGCTPSLVYVCVSVCARDTEGDEGSRFYYRNALLKTYLNLIAAPW